jgi:spoIIIJ-associated protein
MGLEERKKILEGITRELLEKMNVQANIYVASDAMPEDDSIYIQIHTKDSGNLIGKAGKNLFALQHIIRAMASKKIGERINFTVDINSYIENQKEALLERILETISKVERKQEPVELPPMNAYERRIVHMKVAEKSDLETESVGEGESRRVIVKPGV